MAGRDTIFAPATAPGRAAVAVIRASGPSADAALSALVGDLPEERRASVRRVKDPATGEVLDECLVLRFAEGRSFTGEASFELQGHGGRAAVDALLRILAARPGLRLAEPGEFTRRAVENGRLDLSQAEGLADLALAETEAQRRQAVRALSGELGRRASAWRSDLIRARALLEASMDFADEEVPEDVGPEATALILDTARSVEEMLRGSQAAERVRDGFDVALVGPPNSGKSSLINILAKREVAIASPRPGTTRDVIEVRMDVRGLPVTLLDTAGLREAGDEIEEEGVSRAAARAAAADLRIWMGGPGEPRGWPGLPVDPDRDVIITSRADLHPSADGLRVSARTGEGVDALLAEIADRLSRDVGGASVALREHHRRGLEAAGSELRTASELRRDPELVAEHLRRATDALARMSGTVDAEDVLDDIFASFCLGK